MASVIAKVAAAGLLTASSAPAQPASLAAGVEPKRAAKLVCKRIQSTGWRVHNGSMVCRTRAQWAAIRDETQKEYRDYNRGGSMGSFGAGVGGRSGGGGRGRGRGAGSPVN
jgi:hypothetical protein